VNTAERAKLARAVTKTTQSITAAMSGKPAQRR
jgi:hypothetical protein